MAVHASSHHEPLEVSFEHLKYTIKTKKPGARKLFRSQKVDLPLIDDISGVFRPRTVTAIMGPSGAGKTTLLNVLAGRTTLGKVEGRIYANGHLVDTSTKTWKRTAAYVVQEDIMLPTFTPREAFNFAAAIRLPSSVSSDERKERVNALLEELGLTKCADTRVGEPGLIRGVSGGERKRVSIGLELLTNPSLLLLDEPTTGLDSTTALNLMHTLRMMADSGRTIILTIHQPSSEIFAVFDQLLLMAKGRMVYYGPASDSIEYFARLGYACPEFTNPADYFMNLVSPKHALHETDIRERARTASLAESTRTTAIGVVDTLLTAWEQHSKQLPAKEPASSSEHNWSHPYSAPIPKQIGLLMGRSLVNMLRDKMAVRTQVMQNVLLGLLVGLIFLQLGDDQESVQDRVGALFFITVNQSMLPMLNVLMKFPRERTIFLREFFSGSYSAGSYFISKTLVGLPLLVLNAILFAIIAYFMLALQSDVGKFFTFVAVVVLGGATAEAIGFLISASIPLPEVSMAIAPMVQIPVMLFGGLFLNLDSTPVYFIWLKYLSFFRYIFEILVLNEFTGLEFTCSDSERLPNGACRISTGEDEIKVLSMEDVSIGLNFLALVITYFGSLVLAFIFFRINSKLRN